MVGVAFLVDYSYQAHLARQGACLVHWVWVGLASLASLAFSS